MDYNTYARERQKRLKQRSPKAYMKKTKLRMRRMEVEHVRDGINSIKFADFKRE